MVDGVYCCRPSGTTLWCAVPEDRLRMILGDQRCSACCGETAGVAR